MSFSAAFFTRTSNKDLFFHLSRLSPSALPESQTSAAFVLEIYVPMLLLECCFTIVYNSFFMSLDVRVTLQKPVRPVSIPQK